MYRLLPPSMCARPLLVCPLPAPPVALAPPLRKIHDVTIPRMGNAGEPPSRPRGSGKLGNKKTKEKKGSDETRTGLYRPDSGDIKLQHTYFTLSLSRSHRPPRDRHSRPAIVQSMREGQEASRVENAHQTKDTRRGWGDEHNPSVLSLHAACCCSPGQITATGTASTSTSVTGKQHLHGTVRLRRLGAAKKHEDLPCGAAHTLRTSKHMVRCCC
ncbi:hypothetical protein IWX90DRAFT_102314 [Phyllosticta citrichinensis]|uniref:Uncharacterized protein n=1 Tax=Phyllosticta citrichinensis TaxID=1130410 RepID=A0ABR1Y2H5_9PEZI